MLRFNDEAPVTLKEMIVNERNNCIVLTGGIPKIVFGDVFTAALNPFVQGCTDVLLLTEVRSPITSNDQPRSLPDQYRQ